MLKPTCLSIVTAALMAAPLFAQTVDAPIKMTPEFPLAFPFVMQGTVVTVKYPVMINPSTVLKPGVILRTIYVFPQSSDSTDLSIVHATDQSEAYGRTSDSLSADSSTEKMPYQIAHQLEGYRRTVWSTPTNFELAMAQFPTELMHIIYAPTATSRDKELSDQRFSFFDGMLLGLPDGNSVTVLAVENDSKADQAGVKAGDEIVAVGSEPTQHDLNTFAKAFADVRQNARDMSAASYSMTVRSQGQSATHVVNVAMPPTIKSLLMNGL